MIHLVAVGVVSGLSALKFADKRAGFSHVKGGLSPPFTWLTV